MPGHRGTIAPPSRADLRIVNEQPTREREDERKDVVRHFVPVRVTNVRHPDAAFGRGGNVYVVDALAEMHDDATSRPRVEHAGGHGDVLIHHGVGIAAERDRIVFIAAGTHFILDAGIGQRAQRIADIGVMVVGDDGLQDAWVPLGRRLARVARRGAALAGNPKI